MAGKKAATFPFIIIVLILAALSIAFLAASGWFRRELSPQDIVDRQESGHAGFRRAHAKGICVAGQFVSSGALAPYSKAAVFAPGATPLIGRFSIGGGNPLAPDLKSPVRSLALALTQADGQQWRIAMNTPPLLPVNTPEGFFEQLQAIKPDNATGKPNPAVLKAFFDRHPESAPFRAWQAGYTPTDSFAAETYNSINAFRLIDHAGKAYPVRWAAVPRDIRPAASPGDGPDALQRDIAARIAAGGVSFDLVFSFAGAGDRVNDPASPWAAGGKTVTAGTIQLTSTHPQQGGQCDGVNFDPLVLPDGLAPSDDPILRARSPAYAESYRRRAREKLTGAAQ